MGKAQIQKGSQGDVVKEWQDYLLGKGYNLGIGGADGIFGKATEAATKIYQKAMGLDSDGIVGEDTWGSTGSGTGSSGGGGSGSGIKTNPFTTSDETNKAYEALNGLTKPEDIDPTYLEAVNLAKGDVDKHYEKGFSFDLNGDALYQQHKDKYIQQGKMAMQDTMGQAAALTGGYGNSYAATAGNQAYQAHLNNLNDIIPELQRMAYDRYNQEGQNLLNKYSMAMDIYNMVYGKHADELSQYNADRQYNFGVYDSLWGRDYGAYRDTISDEQWQAAMDYQMGRDKIADEQWQKTYDLQKKNNIVKDDVSDDGDKKPVNPAIDDDEGDDVQDDYADWEYGDWEAYFAYIRQTAGKEAAEEELVRMNKAGYIPKNMIVAASIGARGSLGH